MKSLVAFVALTVILVGIEAQQYNRQYPMNQRYGYDDSPETPDWSNERGYMNNRGNRYDYNSQYRQPGFQNGYQTYDHPNSGYNQNGYNNNGLRNVMYPPPY